MAKGRRQDIKNYDLQFQMDAVILVDEKFDGKVKEAAQALGINYDTLRLWRKNYQVIKEIKDGTDEIKLRAIDIARMKVATHNLEVIDRIAPLEFEMIDKMSEMIKKIKSPKELKVLTDAYKAITERFETFQGKPEAEVNITNNTQNNFHNDLKEKYQKSGALTFLDSKTKQLTD